jgi:hypothetical protein
LLVAAPSVLRAVSSHAACTDVVLSSIRYCFNVAGRPEGAQAIAQCVPVLLSAVEAQLAILSPPVPLPVSPVRLLQRLAPYLEDPMAALAVVQRIGTCPAFRRWDLNTCEVTGQALLAREVC